MGIVGSHVSHFRRNPSDIQTGYTYTTYVFVMDNGHQIIIQAYDEDDRRKIETFILSLGEKEITYHATYKENTK